MTFEAVKDLFSFKHRPLILLNKMCSLTVKQIDAIVETWKIPAENYYDSGEYILYKFFERNQDYQTYFKKFKYTALEELKVNWK